MNIKQNLVAEEKYKIKCPYEMTAERIVVHNTDNDASAKNEIAYMIRNDKQVSFHFAVDDKEIWQGVPLNRNTWHCGDGSKGKGNRTGISVEICYSKSGGDKFTASEKNAAKFIAELLFERGWGVDRVGKHQDFNGKNCPSRTLALGWDRFLNMIQAELNALKNPEPVAKKSVAEVAQEVINGKWGNGEERKKKLKAAGYDPSEVQAKVNEILYGKKEKETELKVGDKVRLAGKSPQYGKTFLFASFVYKSVLYVREIKGDRVVISTVKTGAVTGAVHKKYLTKI